MTISPDTKDWTWVLQQPCPQCGFEAAALTPAEVGPRLRQAAAVLAEAVDAPDARTRPEPATWSALEYGCHVRDVFRIFLERLDRMLHEDDPLFANWDQDATAVEDGYAEQDPATVARELRDAVEPLATRYETLPADAVERPGRRSDGAVFTVRTLGQYLAHDVVHHVWDVTRSR